jgi:hypothetical protein
MRWKTIVTRAAQVCGCLLTLASVVCAPTRVVDAFLPAAASAYRISLEQGLYWLRVALFIDGVVLLSIPLWTRAWQWAGRVCAAPLPCCEGGAMQARSLKTWEWWLVGLLAVGAAWLRVLPMGQSFFIDEIACQRRLIDRGILTIISYFPPMTQHVLYSMLAWISGRLVPFSPEVTGRLPSVLFGVASVPLTYVLVRRFAAPLLAVCTAVLMAGSIGSVVWGNMLKSYTATGMLFLFCVLAIFDIKATPGRSGPWFVFLASLCTLLMFHLFNVYLVIVLGVLLVWVLWMGAKGHATRLAACGSRLLVGAVLCVAAVLTFYAVQMPQIASALRKAAESANEEPLQAATLLGAVLQATFWGRWPWASVAVLGLAAVGWTAMLRRDWKCVLILTAPFVLVLVFVRALGTFVYPRYLLFALPVFLCLAVHGVMRIGHACAGNRGQAAFAAIFTALFLLAGAPAFRDYFRDGGQNLRGACRVADALSGGRRVLVAGVGSDLLDYYLRSPNQRIRTAEELEAALIHDTGIRVFVMTYPRLIARQADFKHALEAHFVEHVSFVGHLMELTERQGDVVVWLRRMPLEPGQQL